ncbi:MAG: fibronectin type III domain-containing protein, partial [Limisphaerales bacterium]
MSCRRLFARLVLVYFCLVTSLSAAEIHLTWNPNPETDIAGYKVYATDLTTTNRTIFDVGLETQASFAPELGHTYIFAVTAYNLAGLESAPSTEVRYDAPPESLAVSWDPSIFSTAVNYRLVYGQLNQPAQEYPVGGGTSLFLTGLQRGAAYYFYVEAFDANLQRIDSWQQLTVSMPVEGPLGSLHIPRAKLPPQIQLTSPTSGATYTAPTTIVLSANASDLDGSIRSVEFFAGSTRLASLTTAPYSFSWNNVAAGTYQLNAVATDSHGAIARSVTATITVNISVPPAPTALAASATESSVRLTWLHSGTNETGFRVYRASGGTFALIATLPVNSVEFTDSALTAGTAYTYRVAAFNSAGNSAAAEISVTTKSLPLAPLAPINITAVPLSAVIVIGWDPSIGATQYIVERALNFAGPFTSIGTVQITQLSDANVVPGSTYFYRVIAVASGLSSSPSVVVSSALPTEMPVAPARLTGSVLKGAVKLGWRDSSLNESNFIVERSLDGATFTPIATLAANSTTYSDSTVAPRRKYFYRVAAA